LLNQPTDIHNQPQNHNRGKAGQRHNTGHRSTVQMSRLRTTARVADSFIKRIRKLVTG
jgi:ribosomal protein L35